MEKKSKKRILIGITVLLVVTLVLVGLTYAYYRTRIIGNDAETSISVVSKKLEIKYTDGNSTVNMEGKIEPGFEYIKTFTVENTGDDTVSYSIILDEITNTFTRTGDWTYVLTKEGATDPITIGEISASSFQVLVGEVSILSKTTDSYTLKLTYANSSDDQSIDMGATLSLRINIGDVVELSAWESAASGTLLYALRTNNEVTEPLTVPGQESSLETEAVLASTEDDYGTSYYFRGNVVNNYVNYSGMCWRIVRVQGDGTIKLALADENGECNASTYSIDNTTSALINNATNYAYKSGSNDVSEDYNYGNSDIYLTILPSWLENKNLDTSKLIETQWCNDLSVSREEYFDGVDKPSLYYGAYDRLVEEDGNPTLKCNISGINNTSSLTFSSNIGMLSADEYAYAGMSVGSSFQTYLYYNASEFSIWTMTPSFFNAEMSYALNINSNDLFYVSGGISLSYQDYRPSYKVGRIRASVVLKNDVALDSTISGQNGTQTNPYVIG